jgi:hypothetical protein
MTIQYTTLLVVKVLEMGLGDSGGCVVEPNLEEESALTVGAVAVLKEGRGAGVGVVLMVVVMVTAEEEVLTAEEVVVGVAATVVNTLINPLPVEDTPVTGT